MGKESFFTRQLAFNIFPTGIARAAILEPCLDHYNDITMSTMASQISSRAIVYSTVY